MKESKMVFNENGEFHGYWEVYWDNGNLFYKGIYIHGERHGYWELYYDNGELWYKGNYYMGKKLYQTTKNKFLI